MPESTIDPASIALDDVDMDSEGNEGMREMEELKGGNEQVRRTANIRTDTGEIGEYALGSYVPEIMMEDIDEEDGKAE